MGSNEELSDLDLELLGEKPSTPVHVNERPATSRIPVQVFGTKAPTQAGFTNKSHSSTSPDRIHVFGTTTPAQAGFKIKIDHQLNEHGPVLTTKAPQDPTTNSTPLPSDRRPVFTPTTSQKAIMNAQGILDMQSSIPSQPSENRHIRTAKAPQKPTTNAQVMSDNPKSIKAELEDTTKSKSSFTRDDVVKLLRECQKWEKATEDISKKLSYTEVENKELKEKHSKVEDQLKVELKESSKKLNSAEAENAELNDKYIRAEEALRVKVEQAVKDGRRAQAIEQTLEKLKPEYETLRKAHTVLEHKSKTQTNQVVGCEKKVTKTTKDLAEYKAVAEAKEARLQNSIANLKKGVEDSRKVIRSSGIEERRAEIDGLSVHVDDFEESRRAWVETQTQLEDDLAAVKASLDVKEQKVFCTEEENKKLIQARKDLKKANQDLRHQQNEQTGSTTKEAQALSKHNTQTDYSTDDDQGSSNKKPQCSLVAEIFCGAGIRSGDDEASEEEDKTLTSRDFSSPATSKGWTQVEGDKTVTLRECKPIATDESWIRTQAPKLERSPLSSIKSVPAPPTGIPSRGSKLRLPPVFTVDSGLTTTAGGHLPPKATQSQGMQTEHTATQSQGVQTEHTATQFEATQTELKATQSQGVQTEYTAIQSEPTQTEPKATRSQGVQTEHTAIQSEPTQTEPKATRSQGVQTEHTATQSEPMQTEPKATRSQGVQTEPTATQSEGMQTKPKTTQSQAVQTEPEKVINLDGKKPWYMHKYTKAVSGTVIIFTLLMLLLWAWTQCQAATKERKMWMLANDTAYRLSDEVIRKQAIALLQRTQDRAALGWLTPAKIMTLHQGAHQAFARTFHPLVLPTRSISTASLVQSAIAPTPATTGPVVWPAWGNSLWD